METLSKKPVGKLHITVGVLFLLLFVAASATAVYFFWKFKTVSNAQAIQEKELSIAVKKVGALIDLPTDETPTLATITDKEKLKTQQFFERAENGDQVLFYLKFGRAILYRPSTNHIVDVTVIKTTTPSSPDQNVELEQQSLNASDESTAK